MKNVKRLFFLSLKPRKAWLRRPVRCRGQTLVEYALILAVISVVAIGALLSMGKQVTVLYSMINSQIVSANTAGGLH